MLRRNICQQHFLGETKTFYFNESSSIFLSFCRVNNFCFGYIVQRLWVFHSNGRNAGFKFKYKFKLLIRKIPYNQVYFSCRRYGRKSKWFLVFGFAAQCIHVMEHDGKVFIPKCVRWRRKRKEKKINVIDSSWMWNSMTFNTATYSVTKLDFLEINFSRWLLAAPAC